MNIEFTQGDYEKFEREDKQRLEAIIRHNKRIEYEIEKYYRQALSVLVEDKSIYSQIWPVRMMASIIKELIDDQDDNDRRIYNEIIKSKAKESHRKWIDSKFKEQAKAVFPEAWCLAEGKLTQQQAPVATDTIADTDNESKPTPKAKPKIPSELSNYVTLNEYANSLDISIKTIRFKKSQFEDDFPKTKTPALERNQRYDPKELDEFFKTPHPPRQPSISKSRLNR